MGLDESAMIYQSCEPTWISLKADLFYISGYKKDCIVRPVGPC